MGAIGLNLVDQLKARMHWLQARQKVLAENVANADTPRFKPHDLRPQSEPSLRGVALERTAAGHLAGSTGPGAAGEKNARRFETTPSGNAVTLEEEMMKIADTQADYQAVATLYAKSLSMLKIAIGRKG